MNVSSRARPGRMPPWVTSWATRVSGGTHEVHSRDAWPSDKDRQTRCCLGLARRNPPRQALGLYSTAGAVVAGVAAPVDRLRGARGDHAHVAVVISHRPEAVGHVRTLATTAKSPSPIFRVEKNVGYLLGLSSSLIVRLADPCGLTSGDAVDEMRPGTVAPRTIAGPGPSRDDIGRELRLIGAVEVAELKRVGWAGRTTSAEGLRPQVLWARLIAMVDPADRPGRMRQCLTAWAPMSRWE